MEEESGEENGKEFVLCKAMLDFICKGGGNGMIPQKNLTLFCCQGGAVAGNADTLKFGAPSLRN